MSENPEPFLRHKFCCPKTQRGMVQVRYCYRYWKEDRVIVAQCEHCFEWITGNQTAEEKLITEEQFNDFWLVYNVYE